MADTQKKVIAMTGTTRGLGAAWARELARLGHVVAGCGRDAQKNQKLQNELGKEHWFAPVDVADAGAVTDWANKVLERFGPPDYLVCNAAVINQKAPLWEVGAEAFDLVVDVNVKGVANTCRAFLPAMVQRGSGVVAALSSGAGRSGFSDLAPYCTTKWAIEGMMKSLALELPAGMAAIPLSPGVVDTDMLRISFGSTASHQPKPEAWAKQAAPYLLSLTTANNGESLTVPQ